MVSEISLIPSRLFASIKHHRSQQEDAPETIIAVIGQFTQINQQVSDNPKIDLAEKTAKNSKR